MVPCKEFHIRTLIRKKDKGVEIFNHTMYELIIIIIYYTIIARALDTRSKCTILLISYAGHQYC